MQMDIHLNKFNLELFRTTKNRYSYSYNIRTVWLEFNNTIILNDRVNPDVMHFIYRCRNLKRKVYLLTQNVNYTEKQLDTHHINKSLFAKIVGIGQHYKNNLSAENTILIVNRKVKLEEHKSLNIPILGIDSINSILLN